MTWQQIEIDEDQHAALDRELGPCLRPDCPTGRHFQAVPESRWAGEEYVPIAETDVEAVGEAIRAEARRIGLACGEP